MVKRIPLARGRGEALVDDADYPLVARYRWRLGTSGYARTVLEDGSHTSMHNLITGLTGVDHVNADGLDNRRANLRPATQSQNMANARPRTDGASRFRGVYWDPAKRRWRAQIVVNRRTRYLGRYRDEADAARAWDRAALAAWGEYARLNFPGGQPSVT